MGKIEGIWCFLGKDGEQWCDTGKVDTGASDPVLPYRDAKRLGEPVRLPPPRLADKRRARGRWFMIDAMKSTTHGCMIGPVLVFGQYGRKSVLIGTAPLQKAGADIVLDDRVGDSMKCRRVHAPVLDLGARANREVLKRRLLKELHQRTKKHGPPTIGG